MIVMFEFYTRGMFGNVLESFDILSALAATTINKNNKCSDDKTVVFFIGEETHVRGIQHGHFASGVGNF